jgi:lysophospholipase L1-like esterase
MQVSSRKMAFAKRRMFPARLCQESRMRQLGDEYFHGVLRVIRDEQGVRFARLTPTQLACAEQMPAWGIRARCCAGATLELRTDSPYLDIRFAILSSCRQFFGIDVEIDGVVSHAVRVDEHKAVYEGRLFDLPDRKVRQVRVYLPYTVEIRLERIGLAEGATVEPLPPRARTLLALGDSITQGMEARSPMASYPVQLARLLDAELLNQGVGGHVFDANMLDPEMALQPDVVTVAYGTNDWYAGKGLRQTEADVREYLAKLRSIWPAERTKVVVISPIWRVCGLEKKNEADLLECSRVILETARQCADVMTIDGLTLVPNQPWYLADGTHPDDAGFLHYALNLYGALMRNGDGWTRSAVV